MWPYRFSIAFNHIIYNCLLKMKGIKKEERVAHPPVDGTGGAEGEDDIPVKD